LNKRNKLCKIKGNIYSLKKGDKAMKESSRIKFNPVTKEIEIEGSEKFVKTYFDKIHKMFSESQGAASVKAIKEKLVKEKVGKKGRPSKKDLNVKKSAEKKPRKASNTDKVLALIKESAAGINTAELKEKSGLTDKQIRPIVNLAKKQGKIKNAKRGMYVGA
jgi:hypothetical protein